MVSESSFIILFIGLIAFSATFGGVKIFRRVAGNDYFLDVPNERSSHQNPIPRGGGLVIAVVCLTFLLFFQIYQGLEFVWGFWGGALIITAVGMIDDFRPLPFYIRLGAQIAAALLLIFHNGSFELMQMPLGANLYFGKLAFLISLGWVIWLTNAYNFMDGIDGLAALQAVSAGLGWYFAGSYFNSQTVQFLGCLVAFSALGFYLHNRSPAKIFMGDAGSTFLGFTFASLPLIARNESNSHEGLALLTGIVLLWFFLLDTFSTFVRRIWLMEKVWLPHRKHFYQKLIEQGWTHSQTGKLYSAGSLIVSVIFLTGLFFKKNCVIDLAILSAIILFLTILIIGSRAQKPEKYLYEKQK